MSLSITFTGPEGTDGPYQLASAGGWDRFSSWVSNSPPLRHLVNAGSYVGTDSLSKALATHIDQVTALDDVNHTAQQLLDLLGVGDSEETATVSS